MEIERKKVRLVSKKVQIFKKKFNQSFKDLRPPKKVQIFKKVQMAALLYIQYFPHLQYDF
jgi:hypothetical protein